MRSALFGVALLAGCAQSSGVLKVGPDTYNLSVHAAPARGGVPGAERLALEEANAKCSTEGKEILVNSISSGRSGHLPGGTVSLNFMCLAKGDPDLQRPRLTNAQKIIVETAK